MSSNKTKVRRICLRNGKGVRDDKPTSIQYDLTGYTINLWYLEWDDGDRITLTPNEYREWLLLCGTVNGLLELYSCN